MQFRSIVLARTYSAGTLKNKGSIFLLEESHTGVELDPPGGAFCHVQIADVQQVSSNSELCSSLITSRLAESYLKKQSMQPTCVVLVLHRLPLSIAPFLQSPTQQQLLTV
jgi:hypothetical protein